ncbi:MAG: YdcF family protein, partial [Wenzhouxiangellaceae bacterium]
MEYTEKILTALVLPPGGSLLLASLGLLLAWRQWRGGLALILMSLASLWLLATPAVSDVLRASLENRFPPLALDQVPEADAIVVLGGGIQPPHGPNPRPNLGRAADRYWHAARLWRAGKAPEILITGGALPWQSSTESEAESAARLLVE